MTFEARIAFVIFFFAVWLFFGLLAWASVAVIKHGRGALIALPLALAGAALAGVIVPLLGMQDGAGFALSLLTATGGGCAGACAGLAFAARMRLSQPPIGDANRPQREA